MIADLSMGFLGLLCPCWTRFGRAKVQGGYWSHRILVIDSQAESRWPRLGVAAIELVTDRTLSEDEVRAATWFNVTFGSIRIKRVASSSGYQSSQTASSSEKQLVPYADLLMDESIRCAELQVQAIRSLQNSKIGRGFIHTDIFEVLANSQFYRNNAVLRIRILSREFTRGLITGRGILKPKIRVLAQPENAEVGPFTPKFRALTVLDRVGFSHRAPEHCIENTPRSRDEPGIWTPLSLIRRNIAEKKKVLNHEILGLVLFFSYQESCLKTSCYSTLDLELTSPVDEATNCFRLAVAA
ncbi:hypothetical protein K438DRAFT_1930532 [Mycena galopus ATCC 62051]|nr:hypothetical protein K438DRAFT_1930532 [Mycena galopus ATCC 62051]